MSTQHPILRLAVLLPPLPLEVHPLSALPPPTTRNLFLETSELSQELTPLRKEAFSISLSEKRSKVARGFRRKFKKSP
jgi:hypothetical protein